MGDNEVISLRFELKSFMSVLRGIIPFGESFYLATKDGNVLDLLVVAARKEMCLTSEMKNRDLEFVKASHGIRDSLVGIIGMVEMSINDLPQGYDSKIVFTYIKSKNEAEKIQREEKPFDLIKVLEEQVDLFYPVGQRKGLDVILDLKDGSLSKYSQVKGDKVNSSKTLHKEKNIVSLTVGADPTIGLRRESKNKALRVNGYRTTGNRCNHPLPGVSAIITSEYGIPKILHPKLPGPDDRIVDFAEGKNNRFFWVDERVFPTIVNWRTSAPNDGMPAENTYSTEAMMILNTHRTPIQRQPEVLLCLVGLSRIYYLGDQVYPTFLHDDDRGGLIRTPNHTKMKTGTCTRAAHEIPLLTVTASRVIEMEDPAAETESSGTDARKQWPLRSLSLHEDVTTTGAAPEAGQAEGIATTDPHLAKERRKRGNDGVDTNAPPKVRRRDHVDPRPTKSSRRGKSLAAIELGMGSACPIPASQDVAQERPRPKIWNQRIPLLPPWSGLLKAYIGLNEAEDDIKKAAKGKKSVAQVACQDKRIRSPWEQQPSVTTGVYSPSAAIVGRSWVIGHGLRLTVMKCGESTELRQAFTDVVSTRIDKGMSEVLKHGVEHGKANLSLEAIEAFDPEAEAKYIAALHALKDLKYPIVDQPESLKDAPIDLIMTSLHLESDTGDDAPQWIRELRPSSS
nr:histidine kinase CKI1-like [Tanacetum cinerariifolium]